MVDTRDEDDVTDDALRRKQFGLICATAAKSPGHAIRIENLRATIASALSDLGKIHPAPSESVLVAEWSGSLTFRLVVPAGRQGSVLAPEDGDSRSKTTDAGVDESKKPDDALQKRAMADAENTAQAAASVSAQALELGMTLVAEVERAQMSLEEIQQRLQGSPDEGISRRVYGRAQKSERTLSYPDQDRTIGGFRRIPAELHSAEIFVFRQCTVQLSDVTGTLCLHGNADDDEWNHFRALYPRDTRLGGDADNRLLPVIRLAQFFGLDIDVEVRVVERIETKRRHLEPLVLHNRAFIMAAVRAQLQLLEDLSP